jgi:hypothetical protein
MTFSNAVNASTQSQHNDCVLVFNSNSKMSFRDVWRHIHGEAGAIKPGNVADGVDGVGEIFTIVMDLCVIRNRQNPNPNAVWTGSKKTQCQVDQVCAEDDHVDQQECDDDECAHVSNDMDDRTQEDWVAFQNGSFAPHSRPNFW